MAKAYRTVSNEALCVITGMTPIQLKIEKAVQLYFQTRSQTKDTGQFDNNKEARWWQHPAESVIMTDEENEEASPLQIYTDGSKTEKRGGIRDSHLQIRPKYHNLTI